MTATIELEGLKKAFGEFLAVDGVSLTVEPGRIFGLLGPNGAGKTTTIRMLMDIIAPDSGTVHFFGRPRRRSDLARVGYLPEERGLYRKMSVVDHLIFLGELHGVKRRQSLPAIDRLLERVGLADWRKKKVEELSKGMQQKIQLVGTVLHDPDIVVLDEPFSGLDPINQNLFKEILAEFKAAGKTILFSTHVMEQAEKLCDQICLIAAGKVILADDLAAIKRRFGGRSYRLTARGETAFLTSTPGITEAISQDGFTRLILEPDAVASDLLRRLIEHLEVEEFRSEEPELAEIFISAVREAGIAVEESDEALEVAPR